MGSVAQERDRKMTAGKERRQEEVEVDALS
jgi:hypothetical protein